MAMSAKIVLISMLFFYEKEEDTKVHLAQSFVKYVVNKESDSFRHYFKY